MVDYDIRPLQLHLQENLKVLDEVFRSHGLRYFLVSGTMLGAVRHKGFIPWDDDVDLGMPRADYERLIANSKEWLPDYLEFICAEKDNNYPLPFGKIQDSRTTLIEKTYRDYVGGVYIDIFPLDGVSSSKVKRAWHFKKFLFWYKILYYMFRDPYKHGHGPNSWVPLLCRKVFSRKGVHTKLRDIMMEHGYDESHYMSEHYNRQTRFMPRSVFGAPTPILFEDAMLMGVECPHEYLEEEYGDYMQLPPEEKRKQHGFHYLDLNTPYRDYLANKNGK